MNTESKFKVGDKWKRRDGEIVEIRRVEIGTIYPVLAGSYLYDKNGKVDRMSASLIDLIEKVEHAENKDHVVEKFQRVVFDAENTGLSDDSEIRFPLSELATVARKLYAYEKFIAELKESLKDGDDNLRILAQKIENL